MRGRAAITTLVLAAAALATDAAGQSASDRIPANGAGFHMRFPKPLHWSRVLIGEVSSDGPASCEAHAALRVGPSYPGHTGVLARRDIGIGRCNATWQPLRIRFTRAQRARVLRAARRTHRRPVLLLQVRGRLDGHRIGTAHAGDFPIEVQGLAPRRNSPPGITRISAFTVFRGSGQDLRGNAYIHTPLSWRRTTPDGGLHAEFDRIDVTSSCRAKAFVVIRGIATRQTLEELVSAAGGAGDTAREGRTRHGAWRVRAATVDGQPSVSATKLVTVAHRRFAGVAAYVYFPTSCDPSVAHDAALLDAVERLVRTARLELHLRTPA